MLCLIHTGRALTFFFLAQGYIAGSCSAWCPVAWVHTSPCWSGGHYSQIISSRTPLDSSKVLCHFCQFCAMCKLRMNSALQYFLVMWTQYWFLGYTASYWLPTRLYISDHHPLSPIIQAVLTHQTALSFSSRFINFSMKILGEI